MHYHSPCQEGVLWGVGAFQAGGLLVGGGLPEGGPAGAAAELQMC